MEMMEKRKTGRQLCIMGASTDSPCLYPATEALPHRFGSNEPHLCAFHAATEPLVDESNEIGLSLCLLRAHLKGARNHSAAAPLVKALERIEADFSERERVVDKVLEDLMDSEFKLMR